MRQIGDHHSVASILQSMGNLSRAAGQHQQATKLISEGLKIMHQIGCKRCSALFLVDLACVARACGQLERSVRLLGTADALLERTGIMLTATSVSTIKQTLAQAKEQLGEAMYCAVWSEGRAMSWSQGTAYALETRLPVLSSQRSRQ